MIDFVAPVGEGGVVELLQGGHREAFARRRKDHVPVCIKRGGTASVDETVGHLRRKVFRGVENHVGRRFKRSLRTERVGVRTAGLINESRRFVSFNRHARFDGFYFHPIVVPGERADHGRAPDFVADHGRGAFYRTDGERIEGRRRHGTLVSGAAAVDQRGSVAERDALGGCRGLIRFVGAFVREVDGTAVAHGD